MFNAVAHAEDDVLAIIEPLAADAPPDSKGRSPLHISAEERNVEVRRPCLLCGTA